MSARALSHFTNLPRESLFRAGLLALLIAPSLIYLKPLLAGHIPDSMDTTLYFYPLRSEAARLLHNGELPWWTRSILCGAPLFSNPQMGLAYPGRWLFLALPSGFTFSLSYVLHLGLWAALTAWALRGARAGRAASFWVGAMCLAGSYGWSRFQYGTFIEALPWWALWLGAAERHARGGSRRWLVIGAAAVAMPLLAGAHQLFIYTAFAFGVFVLMRAALDRRRAARWVGFGVFTALIGLALGAAGWWPQILFLRETNRADAMAVPHALAGSFQSLSDILRALIGPWGKGVADAEASASIGALALVLATIIPRSRRRRRAWTAAVTAALFSTAMSLRFVNEQLFEFIPRAALLHDPRRWLGVAHWLWLITAGISLDDLFLLRSLINRAKPHIYLKSFQSREFISRLQPAPGLPPASAGGKGLNFGLQRALARLLDKASAAGTAFEKLLRISRASHFFSFARFAPAAALLVWSISLPDKSSTLHPGGPAALMPFMGTSLIILALIGTAIHSRARGRPRMAIVIAVAPLAGLALEATRLAHSTWATTEMRTVAANTLIQGSAGNSSPLIEAAHLKAGERFYTVDWDIGGVFDYRRPDKADWVNPNLSAPLGVEDLRGYEPARSARYGAWIESAAGWPADKIPWRSHFALPYPKFTPHEPGLAEANVTHAIFPIWGLPLDVRSGDASAEKPTMYRGATPRVAELEFRIIAVLDPTITTPRKAFVVRESGSPIEFDLTNSELAFKQAPEFIRDPARFRLFRISPPAPPPSVSPIVGILLPLAPTDTLLGVYIWNPTLDQQYDFIAESGMAALFRVRSQKESWIQVEASDASLPVQWREIERRIGSTWLRIELETAQNQSVVIRDSYWPGWNAWVNGQYVRVSPSGPNRKGPWRVIKLPARNSPDPVKYQIEMRYFPPGLTGALALTVLAVTVCVAVSLFGRRKGT